ncbi:TldD/PmbA family protein [Massilia antarctica]|uniref:TldD/PmbA family protein n=1 Tax=Massilia antarctica TaxID=2765360 RepID=UPI0006BB73F5|nr:TldD/PmbA family protein [Massilia sp. H27-R4]CUI06750.1 TldD family protein, Actinobacterial subgroup [Janthinobacterium sp. CG23_2]CUU30536.1 TldD family protein, Actinobacterial subgroup [Janthinobacterium sp. CG23_2]
MERRTFLKISSGAAGAILVPVFGNAIAAEELMNPVAIAFKKSLADAAMNAATKAGASYCDVRIGRYLNQFITTRDLNVENIVNTESSGVGVRVIANGAYGFASTNDMSLDSIAAAARQAVAIARANSKLQSEPLRMAPVKGVGEVAWATPFTRDWRTVPIKDKADMLIAANKAGLDAGASFMTSTLFQVNQQKYFASTDGSYIDQDIHRLWAPLTATAVDKASNRFRTRDSLAAPAGMGYEYFDARPADKIKAAGGVATLYTKSYDIVEDARAAGRQAREKLGAKTVEPGKYDLVLSPEHLFLTIHESVGHPTELDRVLGYEANYAGTSFATLDKWRTKKFKFGADRVNFIADKNEPGSLGAVGYDDEGVPAKRWDIIKDGVLVNYQATRDQAHIIGEKESHGCSYADSWNSVQFQRMPNVSLAAGKELLTPDEMVKDVKKGIYILGRGSYSIDQQRYNFQFGGQLYFEIKNGKITGPLEDVAYQSNTQEFWNACGAICDQRDWRMGGSFFDGKGQPSQVSAVSHGSATTRFNGINVINTARKIG